LAAATVFERDESLLICTPPPTVLRTVVKKPGLNLPDRGDN